MLLAERSVHVWRANLSVPVPDAEAILSAEEVARAERFRLPQVRDRWVRARALLRTLLARYVDVDPASVQFAAGEHGKPHLAEEGQLFFNVSHADDLALFAFARGAVGVDVEVTRTGIDVIAIAERALGLAEAERLRTLDRAEREREFLRAWVRHEAVLKCRGSGMGGDLDANGLWISELDVGPGVAAALAYDGPAPQLSLY
jgi:4'-phosphopantetheinyl transferase